MKKWRVKVYTALAAMLVAVLALSGCAKNTAGLRIDGESQKVLFGDNVLGNTLQVEDISTTQFDGHTRGVVRLTNQSKGDLLVQYRFYWYDNDGLEVNTKLAPWKQAILRGQETTSISEVSVNPDGKQFRVQIRELDN